MRETLYRHCKFSANFSFRKMFYLQNYVVILRDESSLNLSPRLDYSYFDYLSILLTAIPCYSFEF
jgi:hypothetical protein